MPPDIYSDRRRWRKTGAFGNSLSGREVPAPRAGQGHCRPITLAHREAFHSWKGILACLNCPVNKTVVVVAVTGGDWTATASSGALAEVIRCKRRESADTILRGDW